MKEMFGILPSGEVPAIVPFYCPVPTNFDPDLAPPGHQLLTLCAVAPTERRRSSRLLRGDWEEAMLRTIRRVVPGLDEHARSSNFDVAFIESWIGKEFGPAVSTGQTPDQVGKKRPPAFTRRSAGSTSRGATREPRRRHRARGRERDGVFQWEPRGSRLAAPQLDRAPPSADGDARGEPVGALRSGSIGLGDPSLTERNVIGRREAPPAVRPRVEEDAVRLWTYSAAAVAMLASCKSCEDPPKVNTDASAALPRSRRSRGGAHRTRRRTSSRRGADRRCGGRGRRALR